MARHGRPLSRAANRPLRIRTWSRRRACRPSRSARLHPRTIRHAQSRPRRWQKRRRRSCIHSRRADLALRRMAQLRPPRRIPTCSVREAGVGLGCGKGQCRCTYRCRIRAATPAPHAGKEANMPIIDHNNATEVPWRQNYRKWLITEEGDGTTSTDAAISEVGIGMGAPLHTHEDDELIVILSGTLSVRYGDETHEVGADHTVVVPPNVPHGVTALGDGPAKIIGMFP
ncbi:MAG: cupin domain-containing protein, partial [Chloroflexi bacterium]|nr:cupin domain-containing protein [Chloroflexota bacterium]